MDAEKRARLAAKGHVVYDDAADSLGLTPAEREMVEFRVRMAREVRRLREAAGMTQEALALAMGSSQSRVAKLENVGATGSAGTDLLLRAYFAIGGKVADLAGAMTGRLDGAPRSSRPSPTSDIGETA